MHCSAVERYLGLWNVNQKPLINIPNACIYIVAVAILGLSSYRGDLSPQIKIKALSFELEILVYM